ncbi:MAG: hypothetical protein Q4G25_04225 [Paracoccus sp. (in: a-proteobacteria)]|nr:hypothetical protein [Paracoccus sp. (in: a-proteobacteria)]
MIRISLARRAVPLTVARGWQPDLAGPRASVLPTAVAALLMAAGTPAAAAPANAGDQIFSGTALTGALIRAAISYGRMIADIRYDSLEVDPARGGVTLRDMRITGIGQHSNCRISLGKMQVSGISFWGADDMRLRLDITDLGIATNCFGPNAAMIGMMTGRDVIPVDLLTVDSRSVASSGAAVVDIELHSAGIARVSASADFDYVSLIAPTILAGLTGQRGLYGDDFLSPPGGTDHPFGSPDAGGEPMPEIGLRGMLNAAHVSVEDLGIWQRLSMIMPPDMADPSMADQIVTAQPGTAMRAAEEQLAQAVRGFLTDPGWLTIEVRPDHPVAFDTTTWTAPEDALVVLAPVATNAPPTPPLALIADPGTGGSDPLALGLALAEGRGLPQNPARAVMILSALPESPEAQMALARLSQGTEPATAYRHAQTAAGLGAAGAIALLDRLESRMSTADLLAVQPAVTDALSAADAGSVPALRNAALAAEEGNGVARSYQQAWRLASLAGAAGDGASHALMARLEARFGDDPDWIRARDAAAAQALNDWVSLGLSEVLNGR